MTAGRIPSVEGGIQPTLLTTKGDLISATAASTVARLPVGSDTQILVADSSTATGLKWASPAGGSFVKVAGTTFSNVASFSLPTSTFTSTYNSYKLFLTITSASVVGAQTAITMKFRASGTDATATSGYGVSLGVKNATPTWDIVVDSGVTYMSLGNTINLSNTLVTWDLTLGNPQRAERHPVTGVAVTIDTGGNGYIPRTFGWNYINAASYDAATFFTSDGTISGYYSVYGLEK